jgi:hypothetical protein
MRRWTLDLHYTEDCVDLLEYYRKYVVQQFFVLVNLTKCDFKNPTKFYSKPD